MFGVVVVAHVEVYYVLIERGNVGHAPRGLFAGACSPRGDCFLVNPLPLRTPPLIFTEIQPARHARSVCIGIFAR